MLSPDRIAQLLIPFDLDISPKQSDLISKYLGLLMRWNDKINLTAIRDPESCVTRHFGESLFLARHATLEGRLLDIGSGAGFPGLALKIMFPDLSVTLLEPIAKKRAFLKEVARACGFAGVEVASERIEEYSKNLTQPPFNAVSSRAVGHLASWLPAAISCLKPGGKIYLWLTIGVGSELSKTSAEVGWGSPIPVPGSKRSMIWTGTLEANQ